MNINLKLTLLNTEKTIKILESINEKDNYAYERAILAYLQLGGLPIFMKNLPAGLSFFHTRTHSDEDFFYKISDISIPPSEFVKYYARCNRPFQSTFYCSETRPTSYMELVEYWAESKRIGDSLKVTLGLWELKKNILSIIVTSPNPQKRESEFDKEHGITFDSILSKYDGEELAAQKLFYEFLFEKFRKPAKKDLKTYIITSAYCNVAFMTTNGEANAIYYPSVPLNGKGVNLCINIDFFRPDNIELKTAIRNEFIITSTDAGKHSFSEISKVESSKIDTENDRIIWETN